MRQTPHIFRKDARALWPQILLVLAATGGSGWRQIARPQEDLNALTLVLAVARWYLIVCAVHQEKLAGDRQWWVCRPYSWKSLLAAKALLVAVFVNAPLLVSDLAILRWDGLPPAWGNLLARQAALALSFLLPAAALAAVTDGLVSFGLVGVAMLGLLFVSPLAMARDVRWGPLVWIPPSVAVAIISPAAIAALVWQYRKRRTAGTRAVVGVAAGLCAAVLMSPPSSWGVALQTHALRAPEQAEGVGFRIDTEVAPVWLRFPHNRGQLALGVHIDGLPAGMAVRADLIDMAVEAPDGTNWRSGWRPLWNYYGTNWAWRGTQDATVSVAMDEGLMERVEAQRAAWHVSLALTVFGGERTQAVQAQGGPAMVSGIGVCEASRRLAYGVGVACRNGAPPDEEFRVAETGYQFTRSSEWVYRVALAPTPVWTTWMPLAPSWNGESLTFHMRQPVAHLRREAVAQLRMADYW